ncbi:hypothetical protein AI29_00180 [bacteria symbiont BFo2 of Frankliniella occidentalis]|nr:hypothetical protein AI29_00180 [bacteria symbiont BFo2 of Frankliniella occidentalis]KYP91590.1 hypothetical protein WB60_06440 [bacteria symbiont BFo2 of Frankliniella occidentalis]KYP96677.1 hypothetical protein WB67_01110 [bacteria symbiont BFo2 of Frankliniella occidentalis]
MDESRKQFEEFICSISNSDICRYFILSKDASGNYTLPRTRDRWVFWQASRQSQRVIAYLTHQGSAVSPDDFEGGETEMHETAKREEWFPLVKKGE